MVRFDRAVPGGERQAGSVTSKGVTDRHEEKPPKGEAQERCPGVRNGTRRRVTQTVKWVAKPRRRNRPAVGRMDAWGARRTKCCRAGDLEKAVVPERARQGFPGARLQNRAKICESLLSAV